MLAQIEALLLEEYSVSQWVLLFFFYSFCGYCWEVFLYIVKERRFVNRGFRVRTHSCRYTDSVRSVFC